jgi:hypothetical protein
MNTPPTGTEGDVQARRPAALPEPDVAPAALPMAFSPMADVLHLLRGSSAP